MTREYIDKSKVTIRRNGNVEVGKRTVGRLSSYSPTGKVGDNQFWAATYIYMSGKEQEVKGVYRLRADALDELLKWVPPYDWRRA